MRVQVNYHPASEQRVKVTFNRIMKQLDANPPKVMRPVSSTDSFDEFNENHQADADLYNKIKNDEIDGYFDEHSY